MPEEIRDIAASVRARLLNLSKEKGLTFDLVLTRFALERLLYRLSRSPHADRFVLKGAMLMMSWLKDPHRGTRDLDLLGFGDPTPDAVRDLFREVLAQPVDDGVRLDVDTLRIDRIREQEKYGGLRLRIMASIGGARLRLAVDIGFGDAVEPGLETLDYWAHRDCGPGARRMAPCHDAAAGSRSGRAGKPSMKRCAIHDLRRPASNRDRVRSTPWFQLDRSGPADPADMQQFRLDPAPRPVPATPIA